MAVETPRMEKSGWLLLLARIACAKPLLPQLCTNPFGKGFLAKSAMDPFCQEVSADLYIYPLCSCLAIIFFKPFSASACRVVCSFCCLFHFHCYRVIFPSLARTFLSIPSLWLASCLCFTCPFFQGVCVAVWFLQLSSWQMSLLIRACPIPLVTRALLSLVFWPLGPFCAMARGLEPKPWQKQKDVHLPPKHLKFEHEHCCTDGLAINSPIVVRDIHLNK